MKLEFRKYHAQCLTAPVAYVFNGHIEVGRINVASSTQGDGGCAWT